MSLHLSDMSSAKVNTHRDTVRTHLCPVELVFCPSFSSSFFAVRVTQILSVYKITIGQYVITVSLFRLEPFLTPAFSSPSSLVTLGIETIARKKLQNTVSTVLVQPTNHVRDSSNTI